MTTPHEVLNQECDAPSLAPVPNAVNWSIFRRRGDAELHADRIQLGPGHALIGGHGHDSIGDYWWVGVRVESLAQWGSKQAINKRGRLGD